MVSFKKTLTSATERPARLVALFLLLSIFLHLILADLFFEYGFQKRMVNFVSTLAELLSPAEHEARTTAKKKRREALIQAFKALHVQRPARQAKLVAARSNFGWTLFDGPPPDKQVRLSPAPQEIPTTQDGVVAQTATEHATEVAAEITMDSQPSAVHKPATTPLPPTPAVATSTESALPPQPDAPTSAAQQRERKASRVIDLDAAPTEQKTSSLTTAERIAQIEEITQALAGGDGLRYAQARKATTTPIAATSGRGPRRTLVRGARREDGAAQERSIIALTKGFIEKLDGEDGTDLIDRDGDPDVKPDFSELKYLMYESKITWCLQAAWKQNFERKNTRNPQEGIAVISFTIDKNGNVTHSEMLQSTGKPELDEMIMKTTKLASPFPPLPSYFNTDSYATGRRLTVTINRFGF